MGITLTSKTINSTYDSLLKLSDNDQLTGAFKVITDGLGNDTGISLNNNGEVKITTSLQLGGGTGTQGTMSWNTDEDTVDLIQNGTTLQIGQEIHYNVKNQTGSDIPNGTAVMAVGTVGASGRILIAPMDASSSGDPSKYIGITTEDIANGEDGKVTHFGKVRGLNTDAYNEGTVLWLDPTTDGGFTATQPTAPNLKIATAYVVNKHANNGTIFVRANAGIDLHNNHRVQVSSLADKDLLVWSSTNSRWENSKTLGNITTGTISSGNITTSGKLFGPNTFYIDPSPTDVYGDGTYGEGKVVIQGDLEVTGQTTTVNSTEVTINDKNLLLGYIDVVKSFDTVSTSTTLTLNTGDLSGVVAGMGITGSGIPADTTVVSITDSTHIVISNAATTTATGVSMTFAMTSSMADGAGITIGGADATLTYASATDDFTFNKDVSIESNQPNLYLKELDTTSEGRIVQSGGILNIQSSGENYSGAGGIKFAAKSNTVVYGQFDTSGNLSVTGNVTAAGGSSTNWNTAYSYSQVGHLPLAGGTITGTLEISGADAENAFTISGSSPTISLKDTTTDADDFYIHVNSNNFYILRDQGGLGDYGDWDSPHPLQLEADTNNAYVYGNTIITSGNIGSQSVAYASNSGTLDNLDSLQFLRSDEEDTAAGKIVFTASAEFSGSVTDGSGIRLGTYTGGTDITEAGDLVIGSDGKTGWAVGDEIGRIRFWNTDGSGIGARDMVKIVAMSDSGNGTTTTAGSGALVFYTSDYNSNVVESMRLNSDQSMTVSGDVTAGILVSSRSQPKIRFSETDVSNQNIEIRSNGGDLVIDKVDDDWETNRNERLRIDAAGAISTQYQITASRLRLTATDDASVSSTLHGLQVGATDGLNLIMDNNELMARNNGAVSGLNFNPDGGGITIHNNTTAGLFTIGGNTIFHAGNYGGLLDDYYLRSDTSDTFSGVLTVDNAADGHIIFTRGTQDWRINVSSDNNLVFRNQSNTYNVLSLGEDNVAIGTTPNSYYALDIAYNQTDPNKDFAFAQRITGNFSGADNTAADREQGGIYLDIDSSADGDLSNEHRLFGVYSDVKFTGLSDLVSSGYFRTENNNSTEVITSMLGVNGYVYNDCGASGGITNMIAVSGFASVEDNGTASVVKGTEGFISIPSTRAANIGTTDAGYFEIQIDSPNAISYGNMATVHAVIDNNEGTVPNFGNQYLFWGDYQGTTGSNAYGIYCEGSQHYLANNLGVNTTSYTHALNVGGKGAFTDNVGINGADPNAYPLNVTGSINTDTDYRIDGVQVFDTSRNLVAVGGTFSSTVDVNGEVEAYSFRTTNAVDLVLGYYDVGITSADYGTFIVNNHADVVISSNLRIDVNHDLVVNQSHSAIAGSGIVFGGNLQPNGVSSISFYSKGSGGATADDVYAAESAEMILNNSTLSIRGASAVYGGTLELENTTTATGSADWIGKINFRGNDSGTGASGIRASIEGKVRGYDGETDLVFTTADGGVAAAERMRIENDGSIIFGDGSADTNVPLQVRYTSGIAYLDGQLNQTMYFNSRCNGTSEGMAFQTVGNTHMFLRRDGFLGLGTTSPSQKLEVNGGNVEIENTTPVLTFRNSTGGTHSIKRENNSFIIREGSPLTGDRMTILSGGNLGIGVSDPDQKLEVAGNAHIDYSLLGRGFRTANRGELHLNATGADDVSEIFFGYGDGYSEANIRWGISDRGVTTGDLNFYVGPAVHSSGAFTTAMTINADATINTTQPLMVNSTGAPAHALDVNGNARVNGNIYVGDIIYHDGDTNSYLRFPAADDFHLVVGGRVVLDIDEGADPDILKIMNDRVRVYAGSGGSGDTADGVLHAMSDVIGFSTYTTSDQKYKENVKTIENPLEIVNKLNGVTFDWKKDGKKSLGYIAQEVEEVLPEMVKEVPSFEKGETYKTVNYAPIVAVMGEAIKEQQSQIDSLKEQIEELKKLIK